MLSATAFQSHWNVGTDPVKLMAARCGLAVIVGPKTFPFDGKNEITPGGMPIMNCHRLIGF